MSSRIRRGPASPAVSTTRGLISRQSSKSTVEPDIPPSPSRSRRNTRGGDSSVKTGGRGQAKESDEDEDEEEESSSKLSRSKRPARNGSSRAKNAEPETVEEGEDDEMVDVSGTTDANGDLENEDLEEIEGEIEEAGEAKITKNGELLGGKQRIQLGR